MQVSLLASGSKGNATFVEMDGVKLLIDAGIGIRRIKNELAEIGETVDDLDAILITHEHSDHVKGLVPLLRACDAPVYSRRGTLKALPRINEMPLDRLHAIGDSITLGKVRIESFNLLHDAAEPCGYSVIGDRKCTVATDLGFVTSVVQSSIEGADALVIEANHDIDMLRNGSYPWPLKSRILGNRGHLANSDTAWTLSRMKKKPSIVFLAHLSEENNRPELADSTVRGILKEQGITLSETKIALGSQNEIVTMGNTY